jgi:Cu+-exporting ATPase
VKIIVEWVLTTPIQVLLCGPFYSSAWKSIRYAKFANVDLLISISTTVAYLYSVIVGLILAIDPSLVNGDTYFETSALIMTFILLGRYLEILAKSKTYTVLDSLNKHHKGESLLVEGDIGESDARTIPNTLIQRNDVLKVLPGDRIPTDGVIVEGTTEVDESMLTGEARPQFKQKDDVVFGGTINRHTPVFVKCTKVPGETTSDMIYQLVEQTQMTKANIENMTDKVSKIFVPVILATAVAVFLIWIILASTGVVLADPSAFPFSLNFALAVLIVSCPCAVGLAVPTATMVGTGVAAKRGILFKGSQIIETLSKARTFCFDKTGTLTTGELTVAEVIALNQRVTREDLLFFAASIERGSNHPIARAVMSYAESQGISSTEPKKTQVKPGLGVVGVVDGKTVQLGNGEFLSSASHSSLDAHLQQVDTWQQQGATVIYLTLDDQLSGVLVLTDTLKPTAKVTMDYLTGQGHEVWVISGDHPTTVKAIASQLNIPTDHVLGGVLPRDKQNKVKELRAHGEVVMIGDGMNDGPALAAASVGMALGSTSSHLAQYAAGVVILNDSLISVLIAVDLAKRITGRIKLNLVWAFVYNTLFIPLAAGALWVPFAFTIPPPFAGLSELVSSVPVVIFSLLLRTYKSPSFK